MQFYLRGYPIIPHQFRAWYHRGRNGPKEGPLQDYEVPMSMLEIAFGDDTLDPPDGAVVDLNLQETSEFSIGDSSA